MQRSIFRTIVLICVSFALICCGSNLPTGDPDHGGLIVPDGFDVIVVADSIGSARHMAVSDNGDIYVKLRGGKPKGIVALRDVNKDGKADTIKYFGDYEDKGNYGTAMRIHNGYMYFSTIGEVYRIKLTPNQLIPDGKVEMIVFDDYKNDVHGHEHIAKPIALDEAGNLYVQYGSPGDVCQKLNRIPGAPGEYPCSQLVEHAGIWKFDANKIGQTQHKDGKMYATGIRSIVAMDWNKSDNTLYVAAHGRDDFNSRNPELYSRWQSAVYPAEEFLRVEEGANGGWPYYYYDQDQGKRILNPEYLNLGVKESGDDFLQPLMAFPAHWAPNDLFFYTGDQFPERYKNGAFIAFHGSTNRAPYPQAGYFVGFIPFENGKPTGKWEVFADGFIDEKPLANVSDAPYRPMAIAMGPDGSLYLSETVKGKIWRVMFKGNKGSFGDANLAKMEERKQLPHIKTPDEINDNLQKDQVAGGQKIYETYCSPCHQRNGKGAEGRFPPLVDASWVKGDKAKLINVLLNGLEGNIDVNGVGYNGVMPKHAFLSDEEVAGVLTYVRQKFGSKEDEITADEVGEQRKKIVQEESAKIN